jgi:hypothetical protein
MDCDCDGGTGEDGGAAVVAELRGVSWSEGMGKCGRGGLKRGGRVFLTVLCVLEMEAPSGRVMAMMLLAIVMLSRLLETLEKWPVDPVSITVVVLRGGGGVDCVGVTILLVIFVLLAVRTSLAGPLEQDQREDLVRVRGLGTKLAVVPPIMLLTVVST